MCPTGCPGPFTSRKSGDGTEIRPGFCARRTGRLLGGSTAFFAKKAVGKKAQRGDTPLWTPPKRIPAFIRLRQYFQSAAWPIPGFPPIRKALYPGKNRWPKAAHLEGSGEGNEKFPSPPFLSPVSFPRKEIGRCPRRTPARRAQLFRASRDKKLPFHACTARKGSLSYLPIKLR